MYKLDLHTHSEASPDGGITALQYQNLLHEHLLDFVAITDHNRIDFAQKMHSVLGKKVIVGEEIMSNEGEIIGLFLTHVIQPGHTARATCEQIKKQGGLVYIPHPFETVRKGVSKKTLNGIEDLVDIMEAHNGRAVFQNKGPQAVTWATLNRKVKASASDAHGLKGLGSSYTIVSEEPNATNLVALLTKNSRLITKRPPLKTLLYPKFNRVKKIFGRK